MAIISLWRDTFLLEKFYQPLLIERDIELTGEVLNHVRDVETINHDSAQFLPPLGPTPNRGGKLGVIAEFVHPGPHESDLARIYLESPGFHGQAVECEVVPPLLVIISREPKQGNETSEKTRNK